jgi:hypothetical protein
MDIYTHLYDEQRQMSAVSSLELASSNKNLVAVN